MKRVVQILVLLMSVLGPHATFCDENPMLSGAELMELIERAESIKSHHLEGVVSAQFTRRTSSGSGLISWNEYYEVVAYYTNPDADAVLTLRRIPDDEFARRQSKSKTGLAAEELAYSLNQYAGASVLTGMAVEHGIVEEGGANPLALLFGTSGGLGDNRVPSCAQIKRLGERVRENSDAERATKEQAVAYYARPLTLMTENACFLAAAAEVYSTDNEDIAQAVRKSREEMQASMEQIEYRGLENINGNSAHRLHLGQLAITESTGEGGSVTINKIDRWMDARHYLDVKLRIEGVMNRATHGNTRREPSVEPGRLMAAAVDVHSSGDGSMRLASRAQTAAAESREFYLEFERSDFRTVAGTNFIYPYREVLRMGGMLGPDEEAQLKDAQRQMAEFEQQMASMPESQRRMMESMIGPQLAQMRSLVESGTFETEIITTEVLVNPDWGLEPPDDSRAAFQDELLARIQRDLVTLGYEPGNTHGELSRETIAAIVSFQRDNKLELTGQPSPQLAGILAARVKQAN